METQKWNYSIIYQVFLFWPASSETLSGCLLSAEPTWFRGQWPEIALNKSRLLFVKSNISSENQVTKPWEMKIENPLSIHTRQVCYQCVAHCHLWLAPPLCRNPILSGQQISPALRRHICIWDIVFPAALIFSRCPGAKQWSSRDAMEIQKVCFHRERTGSDLVLLPNVQHPYCDVTPYLLDDQIHILHHFGIDMMPSMKKKVRCICCHHANTLCMTYLLTFWGTTPTQTVGRQAATKAGKGEFLMHAARRRTVMWVILHPIISGGLETTLMT